MRFSKAVILGATGPTGKFLARELRERGIGVRVVARNAHRLEHAFPGRTIERLAADMLDTRAALRALEGCDLVFDCIGLPMDRMADHPRSAKNIAAAIRTTGGHCIYVSSYWTYLPIQHLPIDETHPRVGGNRVVRLRRQAEDILRDAGAAVVNLPDFYGPEVHTATLQQALVQAVEGKTVNWVGSLDTAREYVYAPDAMKAVAQLAFHEDGYGEHGIVPGAGPISLRRVLAISEQRLGHRIPARARLAWTLRLLSLWVGRLRAFMPMVPTYLDPISFDGTKLCRRVGELPLTPYERGIPKMIEWLAGPSPVAR
jgi:nucleoside-diphosphate-sugar epimerase